MIEPGPFADVPQTDIVDHGLFRGNRFFNIDDGPAFIYLFNKDRIADMTISDIRRADILDFRERLRKKAGPRTVNSVMTVLKTIFREGYFREELTRDPSIGIGAIRYEMRESGIFIKDEIKKLFPSDSLGPWQDQQDYTAFLIAATCGLRRGEILALRWRHLDFDKAEIRVEEAWKDKDEVGEPKWGQKRIVIVHANIRLL